MVRPLSTCSRPNAYDVVSHEDLPGRIKELNENTSLKWQDIEKAHIEKVLKLKNGNQRQTWLALGYGSINTFRSRLKEYGIVVEENSLD